MIPTDVTIPDPTKVKDWSLVPAGLCQFYSCYPSYNGRDEMESKIYFKHEPHCIDFVIGFGTTRGTRAWVNSSYSIKKPGHYIIPTKLPYLADLVSPVTANQFIELFISCDEIHPALDWILFNLDMILEIQ